MSTLLPMAAPISGTGAEAAGSGGAAAPGSCEDGVFCPPSTPDPMDCGTLTLKQDIEVKRVPGTVLVVFDQSLSMSDPWGTTGQTKLQAAQTAIANAIMTLQDSLTVGAIFFPTLACMPSPGGGLGGLPGGLPGGGPGAALPGGPGGLGGLAGLGPAVNPIEGDGQIPFQAGPQFVQSWAAHWQRPEAGAGIGTPMQEAFDRADQAIVSMPPQGALAVVAVTDGAPNCFPGGTDTALETQRASTWLANAGIKTYVVGLPGAAGVQVLNDVAQSGGTTEYLLPDDPKMLENKLKEVVMETVKNKFDSCSIKLSPAANPPDMLELIVVEAANGKEARVDHMLSPDAGWTITPDGMQADLVGGLCDDAKTGRFSKITFMYHCPETPPPPSLQPTPN